MARFMLQPDIEILRASHIICVILCLTLIAKTISKPVYISSSHLLPYSSVPQRHSVYKPAFGNIGIPSMRVSSSRLSGDTELSSILKRQEETESEGDEENELDEALKVLRPMLFLLPFVISAVPFSIPVLPIALSFMTPAEAKISNE